MRTYTKTVELDDYKDMPHAQEMLHTSHDICKQIEARIDIGNEHRFWEYGMAIDALQKVYPRLDEYNKLSVLDVGAGVGLLGPTLSLGYQVNVTEIEPEVYCKESRETINKYCAQVKRPPIKWLHENEQAFTQDEKYDAVFCISVVEHLEPIAEAALWGSLAARVKPGGLLFMTMDVIPVASKPYTFDNLRWTNYTTDVIFERVSRLVSDHEMVPLGEPDYKYHGSFVYDYSFFSIGMVKRK